MIRAWIAVALLAGSWMFGLDYFYPANPWIWAMLVACAAVLLSGFLKGLLAGRDSAIALLLLVPALIFVPWPLKIMPLLIALGLVLHLLPSPHPSPLPEGEGTLIKRLAQGVVAAGVILAAQLLALAFYTAQTARSHELPKPLPDLLAAVANLLSIDAAADGSKIVMHSMPPGASVGRYLGIAVRSGTFCFFVGGLCCSGLERPGRKCRRAGDGRHGFEACAYSLSLLSPGCRFVRGCLWPFICTG